MKKATHTNLNIVSQESLSDFSTDMAKAYLNAWIIRAGTGVERSWSTRNDLDYDRLVEAIVASGGDCTFVEQNPCSWDYVVTWPYAAMRVSSGGLRIMAKTSEDADRLVERFSTCYVEVPHREEFVPLMFSTNTAHGPSIQSRWLTAPLWSEIGANYVARASSVLDWLMGLKEPAEGRLILFSGMAGTGKTTACRALVREWRKWCRAVFVLDPEEFFGKPEYMISMLPRATDEGEIESFGMGRYHTYETCDSSGENGDDGDDDETKWTLFIFEDADEYVTSTAKSAHGRAVARALNLLDGMIGQGLRVLMLCTANLEESELSDAFARPGRAMARIDFDRFNREEAVDWLKERGGSESSLELTIPGSNAARSREDYSLAELYAYLRAEQDVRLRS